MCWRWQITIAWYSWRSCSFFMEIHKNCIWICSLTVTLLQFSHQVLLEMGVSGFIFTLYPRIIRWFRQTILHCSHSAVEMDLIKWNYTIPFQTWTLFHLSVFHSWIKVTGCVSLLDRHKKKYFSDHHTRFCLTCCSKEPCHCSFYSTWCSP